MDLSPIDTYFMIDCVNGGKVPGPGPPVDPSDLDSALPTPVHNAAEEPLQ